MDKDKFDFWYAVNNTQVVVKPSQALETFGTTVLKYHLVSELMDTINQVRIREGTIKAARPQIITPSQSEEMLEGFGDEAREYVDWLRHHEQELRILQYGFVITKQEISEEIVSDRIAAVVENVEKIVRERNEPHSAVLVGVDKPWEVCLLKLLRDVVSNSAPGNLQNLMRNQAAADQHGQKRIREEIEEEFNAARRNPALIQRLGATLQRHNVFKEYEDRFFELVRRHEN
ncbi:MAG: hypothetical protein O2923_10060 [Verrucomicrobia bacterium]|nr:hypothetical protein [Verrucomicrobiota bacterium]MDA1087003.1 hypothetical protein [Verrucomicrobiota bacterium]